jgi:hypothetical protein
MYLRNRLLNLSARSPFMRAVLSVLSPVVQYSPHCTQMDRAMKAPTAYYHSYLLRIWRDDSSADESSNSLLWRASVESVQTGERRAFISLSHLFAYLEDELSNSNDLASNPEKEKTSDVNESTKSKGEGSYQM